MPLQLQIPWKELKMFDLPALNSGIFNERIPDS